MLAPLTRPPAKQVLALALVMSRGRNQSMNETTDATAIFAPLWRHKWLILAVALLVGAAELRLLQAPAVASTRPPPRSISATAPKNSRSWAPACRRQEGRRTQSDDSSRADQLEHRQGSRPRSAALRTPHAARFTRRCTASSRPRAAKRASSSRSKEKRTARAGRRCSSTRPPRPTSNARTPTTASRSKPRSLCPQAAAENRSGERIQSSIASAAKGGNAAKAGECREGCLRRRGCDAGGDAEQQDQPARSGPGGLAVAAGQPGQAEGVGPDLAAPAQATRSSGSSIGLLLAALAAYALEPARSRLRSLSAIEAVFRAQILAALRAVKRPLIDVDGRPEPRLRVARGALAAADHAAVGNGAGNGQSRAPRTILFISADAGDGKSTLVAALALAQRRRRRAGGRRGGGLPPARPEQAPASRADRTGWRTCSRAWSGSRRRCRPSA